MKLNKQINTILSIVVLLGMLVLYYLNTSNIKQPEGIKVTLASCVDGDTGHFYIDNVDTKVRFIGIDTPEVEGNVQGESAKEYVCKVLTEAKEIILEKDPKSDATDKFGRALYWVWVDGVLLEKDIVEKGYGKVRYIYDDYLYVNVLYDAQEVAKNNKLGVWKD